MCAEIPQVVHYMINIKTNLYYYGVSQIDLLYFGITGIVFYLLRFDKMSQLEQSYLISPLMKWIDPAAGTQQGVPPSFYHRPITFLCHNLRFFFMQKSASNWI